MNKKNSLIKRDQQHVWHPYSAPQAAPLFGVHRAHGVRLQLTDGRELIDGMSSWWSAIHGYRNPHIEKAVREQLERMPHVMFGGLTHEPAVSLCERLAKISPDGLERVFLSDSGSVAVEVAIKMAFQYWIARGEPKRNRLLTIRGGYHGDTFGTMAVCDPVNGMHEFFQDILTQHFFAPRPESRFGEQCTDQQFSAFTSALEAAQESLAAVILEPIVQGAGGMWFYSADFLRRVHALCREKNILLIFDEVATGFGRTGKMFAAQHAGIAPDILCVGKSLTGGTLTLAATLCTNEVTSTIASVEPGALMHGPTFMGNPLACAAAHASLDLLARGTWQDEVAHIESALQAGLEPCKSIPGVKEVRVLGAIGVVELERPVDMNQVQPAFVDEGVWIRPFGRLVYTMPPFITKREDVDQICTAIKNVLRKHHPNS